MKTFLFKLVRNGKVVETFTVEATTLYDAQKSQHLYGCAGGEWVIAELNT